MVAGHFNRDRYPDVMLAQSGVNALVFLPGRGDGTFGEAQPIPLEGAPTALLAADFGRRDTREELIAAVQTESGSRLLIWQDHTGALNATPRVMDLPAEAVALAAGQLTDDANLDLAVATAERLLIFSGSGPTKPRKPVPPIASLSQGEEPGDVDDDDDTPAEPQGVEEQDQQSSVSRRARPPVEVRSAAWQRRFERVEFDLFRAIPLGSRPTSLAVGDFDGNRWPDVAVLEAAHRQVVLYRNLEGQQFEARVQFLNSQPVRMVASNVSGDRHLDLVLIDEAGSQLAVMLGSVTGEFKAPVMLDVNSQPTFALSARLNRDGLDELIVLKKGQGTAVVASPDPGDITVDEATDEFNLDGDVSLREAIFAANIVEGPNRILFAGLDFPGTIAVDGPSLGALPALMDVTGGTTIDGTGSGVTIDGDDIGCAGCNGLKIDDADDNAIIDLTIQDFASDGIEIDPSNGNIIDGCSLLTNGANGVLVSSGSDDNTVMDCTASENSDDGFDEDGTGDVLGNTFTGCTSTNNGDDGFDTEGGNNTVEDSPDCSENGDDGVDFDGNNNTVSGSSVSENDDNGVEIDGDGNTVGPGNEITMNAGDAGVEINTGTGNMVIDNPAISSNEDDGVEILDDGNTVEGNTIEDNTDDVPPGGGINFDSPSNGNVVRDNTIAGNTDSGVLVNGDDNVVDPNTIMGNTGDGVLVVSGTGNTISRNSIFDNGERGIDLDADGAGDSGDEVTPNDTDDPDSGANNLQNFPELDLVCSDGATNTHIEGTLNSIPGESFTIEFFANDGCDTDTMGTSSGTHGEGETFLGSTTVMTDAGGDVTFTVDLPVGVSASDVVTATATRDSTGDTSEFSECEPVTPNAPPVADAGPDQSVDEGSTVMLDGCSSSDPDMDSLTFMWTQTGGPPVTLSDSTICNPTFTAPSVPITMCVPLTFQLKVTDECGNMATDTVMIFVNDVLVLQDQRTPLRCLRIRPCGPMGTMATYCWTGPVEGTITGNVTIGPVVAGRFTFTGDNGLSGEVSAPSSSVARRGSARISPAPGQQFGIQDNNINDSVCVCP